MNAKKRNNGKSLGAPLWFTRIPRGAERAFELSLANNVWVYIKDEDLEAMAKLRPDSYLQALEEIASVISHPDFVSFDQEADTFHFCKFWYAGDSLKPVYVKVEHKGRPQKWFYAGLVGGPKSPFYGAGKGLELRRPIWKNVSS